jgi:hypothetical protein
MSGARCQISLSLTLADEWGPLFEACLPCPAPTGPSHRLWVTAAPSGAAVSRSRSSPGTPPPSTSTAPQWTPLCYTFFSRSLQPLLSIAHPLPPPFLIAKPSLLHLTSHRPNPCRQHAIKPPPHPPLFRRRCLCLFFHRRRTAASRCLLALSLPVCRCWRCSSTRRCSRGRAHALLVQRSHPSMSPCLPRIPSIDPGENPSWGGPKKEMPHSPPSFGGLSAAPHR